MSTLTQFFGGSPIKSIQRGTILVSTAGGNTSATATISSVNTAKSMLNLVGSTISNSSTTTAQIQHVAGVFSRLQLSNSTTVTATLSNATVGNATLGYEVIEYN